MEGTNLVGGTKVVGIRQLVQSQRYLYIAHRQLTLFEMTSTTFGGRGRIYVLESAVFVIESTVCSAIAFGLTLFMTYVLKHLKVLWYSSLPLALDQVHLLPGEAKCKCREIMV